MTTYNVEIVVTGRDQLSGPMGPAGGALSRIGQIAGGILSAQVLAGLASQLVNLGKSSILAASDMAESANKMEVVFGEAAGAVSAFASQGAQALGMSQRAATEAVSTFGNLFVSMGIGEQTSADLSIGLTRLAADLASFNNIAPDEALVALRAGLVGETEPLRRLGVNLNQATLEAKAMEMGLWDGKDAIDAASKAQAAYALIMEQTTTAQGDFERTAGGLANQMRIAEASWQDAQAAIGTAFLPVTQAAMGFIINTAIPAVVRFGQAVGPQLAGMMAQTPALFAILQDAVQMAFALIQPALDNFAIFWQINGPAITSALTQIGAAVLNTFQTIAGMVIPFAVGLFESVSAWFLANGPLIAASIQVIADFFTGTLLPAVEAAIPAILSLVEGLVGVVLGVVTTIMNILTGNWSAAWNSAVMVLQGAWNTILSVITGFLNAIAVFFGSSLAEISATWGEIWNQLGAMVQNANNVIVSAAVSIVNGLISTIANGAKRMYTAGQNLFGNFFSGISKKVGEIMDWLKKKVDEMSALLNALAGGGGGNLPTTRKKSVDGERASGGPVLAGRTYVVGENGIETFVPGTNGFILPASQPRAVTGAGGNQITIQINGAQSPREVAREVARELRLQGVSL